MPEEPSVPPGSQPFQQIGQLFLTNLENRMERLRSMVTSFYRQFDDWDNDQRVQKAKIIDAELRGLVSSFRGLARRRGELNEFEYQRKAAWKKFEKNADFTGFNDYVQNVLELCVDQLDFWKFLFQIQSPSEDVVEYIYNRTVNSIKDVIIKEMIRAGQISTRNDIQFLGVRADIPSRVSELIKGAQVDG